MSFDFPFVRLFGVLGNSVIIVILMLIIVVLQIYLYIYRVFPAGGKGLVNVTCDDVNLTHPPSTTIETTSGAIASQTTDIFATTHVIIGNNSNKTSEISTQVIETTNNGNPITIYLSRIWFQQHLNVTFVLIDLFRLLI